MSQSAAHAGRSLVGEVLHWALPRLAIYALAALGSVVAFTIWAVVYAYVWPGQQPVDAPALILEPTLAPTPAVDAPATEPSVPSATDPVGIGPAIARVPSDALTVAQLRKLDVYDPTDARIGEIEDVVFSPDGRVYAFIVGVGGGFLGGQEKDIAVPFKAMHFNKKNASTLISVLHMSKDDVRMAPGQKFDAANMKWVVIESPGVTIQVPAPR
jgi:hypothetical protein